ncbi:MAG: 3'-5' exonuclease [Actinomycetota bacterium]
MVSLDFTAIDFETANSSPASPCAVGLVRVRGGEISETLELLFRPPYPNNWFSEFNIRVHGIKPEMIENAPEFPDALEQMLGFIESDTLIAHNAPFDMGVLRASAELIGTELPTLSYLCSLQLARKTYNLESYRLNEVSYAIGHEEFRHHDALADSDACARIVIHAAARHGANDLVELAKITRLALKTL